MAQSKRRRRADAKKAEYELTEKEWAGLEAFRARAQSVPAGRVKVLKDGDTEKITPDHPVGLVGYGLLMDALGTGDVNFGNGLLGQLANAGARDEGQINFMLSVVKGIKPKDQFEAMLAAQMAAVHMATMTFARRLAHVENIRSRTAPNVH